MLKKIKKTIKSHPEIIPMLVAGAIAGASIGYARRVLSLPCPFADVMVHEPDGDILKITSNDNSHPPYIISKRTLQPVA